MDNVTRCDENQMRTRGLFRAENKVITGELQATTGREKTRRVDAKCWQRGSNDLKLHMDISTDPLAATLWCRRN